MRVIALFCFRVARNAPRLRAADRGNTRWRGGNRGLRFRSGGAVATGMPRLAFAARLAFSARLAAAS
jgi:hypothetical protein